MNFKKLLKSNFGHILLSFSIVIAALLFKPSVSQQVTDSGYEKRIHLEGSLHGNSAETNFKSELTVGEGQKLLVVQKDGTKELIDGKDIVAWFWHRGNMLQVEYLADSGKVVSYYTSPIKWMNIY